MANLYQVEGYYGTRNSGTILVYETYRGKRWYCVEGSCNINCTYNKIIEGTNVESLSDVDTMSSDTPIESLSELYDIVTS